MTLLFIIFGIITTIFQFISYYYLIQKFKNIELKLKIADADIITLHRNQKTLLSMIKNIRHGLYTNEKDEKNLKRQIRSK